MNILLVNWRCVKNPEMGGAEVHLHEIFRRIVKRGHNVTLVAHQFEGAPEEETIDGIKIIRIGNKFLFNHQFRRYYNSNLVNEDFDIIVDDISKIPLNTPRYVKKPVVGILHHIHGNSLYKEIPFPLAFYIIKSERLIPKYYTDTPIFTVSQSTTKELVELGIEESNTGILHNAIDHNLFSTVNPEKAKEPLITYIGRIKNYKNISTIIESISIVKQHIPNIKFIIGGKGDNLENLKQQVENLELKKHVEFVGFLTEEEKAELLGKAWIFTTMAEKEGWGITVIEANAMKTPAIGSDVPGLRDSIKDGETGHLVTLGNSKMLADKIISLINDKTQLEILSSNAYSWSKKFSWDQSADHFLSKICDWYPILKSKL